LKKIPQPHGGAIVNAEKGETANPNGRPKKSFRLINDELKSKGFEPLTRGQLIELYSLIFNTDAQTIKELAQDEKNPLAIRLAIQELTDPATRGKALQDYRNYAFGTATQHTDITSQGEKITPPIQWVKPDDKAE
jgi:hypothetical protein